MARELEAFPEKHGNSKYDWTQWLNGRPWQLVQGEDFDIPLGSFRTSAIQAAKERGGKVRTSKTGENTLVIQFYKPEEK